MVRLVGRLVGGRLALQQAGLDREQSTVDLS
jgi:hypothetical protein